MNTPKTYRTAEAASLSINFQASIDTLTDVWSDALAAIPEPERPAALVAGKVAGLSPVLGVYVAALYLARDADYLSALRLIRDAVMIGLDPDQATGIVSLIHRGISAELRATPGLANVLFQPSTLALVRWVEAKTHGGPAFGAETEIVVTENRPLVEIREVFTRPFVAEVPVGAGQDAYLEQLLETANDPSMSIECRVQSIVNVAAIALAADDFPAAVRLVAQAVRLAPDDDSAGIGACFMWLTINAAGRDGKLTDVRPTLDWLDVVAVLEGVLRYETRHAVSSNAVGTDPDGGINAALLGRQSSP